MTTTTRTVTILGAAILSLVGLKVGMTLAHPPSDQQLIKTAISDSLEASRKGQPGGVLDLLSHQLTVNQNAGPDNSQVAEIIRKYKPDIQLENENAMITGDEGRIVTPVTLSLLGQTAKLDNVMLVFRKEEGHGFLFLPTPKWRLTDVRLSESQLPGLAGQ